MAKETKLTLTGKQLDNNNMLMTATLMEYKCFHKQKIADIDVDAINRKALILKANTKTEKPVIGEKKIKVDKTGDISTFIEKAKKEKK